MEKMKKVLSAALSAVLLACSVVCGISALAAGTPTKATPLTGWTQSGNFYQYRTLTEVQPLGFTTAVGRKISASSTAIDPVDFGNIGSSQAYFGMNYSADNYYSIADTTGILLYVKTDGANDIMPIFELLKDGVSYNVSFLLSVGKEYQYAALNSDKWETGTVKAGGKTDSTFWGTFGFDGAFEGYVKIPYSSLANDGGKKIDTASDQLAVFGFKLRGLGGDFGSTVIGPVMLITADSTSTKIEVPEAYRTAPIKATPLTGWEVSRNWRFIGPAGDGHEVIQPLGFTTARGLKIKANSGKGQGVEFGNIRSSQLYIGVKYASGSYYTIPEETTDILVYLKTESANNIVLNVLLNDGSERTFSPKVGTTYQYAALNADSWSTGTTKAGGLTGSSVWGSFGFDGPFEGYVKIPFESLKCDLGNSEIDFTKDKLQEVKLQLESLGEAYEKGVVAGPVMLVTEDSTSAKIEVPDEFKPKPVEVKSVDFKTVRAGGYNFSAEAVENGYRLYISDTVMSDKETKYVKDAEKWSYVEADGTNIGGSGYTNLLMVPTLPLAPKDSEGFLVYLKTDSANALAFCLIYENGKELHLKPNTTVSMCPAGSEAWADKTVEIGQGSRTDIYGIINFDAAFEGYVKIPYSALNNDLDFKPSTTSGSIDRIKQAVLRFKGIGGNVDNGLYGSVTAGLTGYITADSASVEIGVSAPIYEPGDVNNDWSVDSADLIQLRKYLLGAEAEINVKSADIDKDTEGAVNIIDLIRLKKLIAGR